jgi:preprotein translocase subunit SecF
MAASTASRGGLFGRLYRGDSNIDFIGPRKKWYAASALIIAICVVSIIIRGFNFGIDFKGGDQYQLSVKPGTSVTQITNAVQGQGVAVSSVVTAGSGSSATYRVQTEKMPADTQTNVIGALEKVGDVNQVSFSSISSTWGGEVSDQALRALIVFLFAVAAFIWIRFRDWRMSVAALGALIHDLILTAGVYSLSGFSVTPSTVVGLLTILGFSLYDTVVVFDKVDENSRGILAASRYTYAESANLAVNQTIMRSINTSLIGLLPVAGLLFVGAGILGVGTLEDLALVLFVGMLTGAYSSLFLATPWLVDLKMLDARYKNHAQRVLSRRASAAAKAAAGSDSDDTRPARRGPVRPAEMSDDDANSDDAAVAEEAYAGTVPPRVGAKPTTARPGAAKRSPGARPAANRPGGGKRRA